MKPRASIPPTCAPAAAACTASVAVDPYRFERLLFSLYDEAEAEGAPDPAAVAIARFMLIHHRFDPPEEDHAHEAEGTGDHRPEQ